MSDCLLKLDFVLGVEVLFLLAVLMNVERLN